METKKYCIFFTGCLICQIFLIAGCEIKEDDNVENDVGISTRAITDAGSDIKEDDDAAFESQDSVTDHCLIDVCVPPSVSSDSLLRDPGYPPYDGGGRGGNGGAGGNVNPNAICGNGVKESTEECDDGNEVSEDGCNEYCEVEDDWVCPEDGGRCVSKLGNPDCSPSACRKGSICIEEQSGLSCRCPETSLPECSVAIFFSLPFLDGTNNCCAKGISADGSTVVGTCLYEDHGEIGDIVSQYAVTWTLDEGIEVLPLSPDPYAEANAANFDGSVVVGTDFLPWRFSEAKVEYISYPSVPKRDDSGSAIDVSTDGSVVVGVFDYRAFRWTSDFGTIELSPLYPDIENVESGASGVSGDGRIVVGSSMIEGVSRSRAVRWNADDEIQELPIPSDTEASVAKAANQDGAVIVGTIWPATGSTRAVRWTADGVAYLSSISSSASAVTADGSKIYGYEEHQGVIWDDEKGTQYVKDVLADAGVNLEDWSELGISDVSGDGKVIVGSTQYLGSILPSGRVTAFVAYLP